MVLFVDIKKKLPGFSLEVLFEAGAEALGLLGASGAGKSMTLRCIAGLEKPDKGRIILNGQVLFDSDKGINVPCRKRKIGFLFQNYALFPNMTVGENIGFALEGMDKRQRNGIVSQKIAMVRLQGLEGRYPHQLSGGQQQRVALARALAVGPEALLLDEPFSALDEHLRDHMVEQLMDSITDYHGATLFVTHKMDEAYRVCRKLVILNNGRMEAEGFREALFQSPPTLVTAQLTGCRNFSAAGRTAQDVVEAVDWGIRLKIRGTSVRKPKYVGIPGHCIRLAEEKDRENVFECWPCHSSEAPFNMTVYLSLSKTPQDSDENRYLQWAVSKEMWLALGKLPAPWKICLDPDKLVLVDR